MPSRRQAITRKRGGGRPRKFGEPSRPVTLTLPESTLENLRELDEDRGRAIVKLARNALCSKDHDRPPVEIVRVGETTGLIIVGRNASLGRIPFLHLVEVAPARFLLALEPGHDFRSLELALRDALEETPLEAGSERTLLECLLERMRELRKAERMRSAEIILVRFPSRQRTRPAKRRAPNSTQKPG